ncbi:MAG: hypothetical protein ABS46_16390 [Cytophagaceae bacterium SCN 52-12]|nr:MAG: hypothetical protein ABS46_16390 [Cytophagaceae bacterium SCN 52-12]
MNVRILASLVMLFAAGPFILTAQVITRNPVVEEASVNYVKITKVEITDRHTAIYLRFKDNGRMEEMPQQMPGPRFFQPRASNPEIWIDPNTRLYKPGDVNTKFRFLRAEGIPTNPERKQVESGETVEFIAYFEKVTPGIEIIDFYEGKSTGNTVAWNFYGIHINNPDPRKKPSEAPKKAAMPDREETVAAESKPAPAFTGLSGSVLDAATGKPVPAVISYMEGGDTIKISTGSGKFRIALEPGGKYVFKAAAEGFGDETWELDTSADSAGTGVFRHDFRLSPLSEGTTFTLENIYFETSSYTLLSESFDELDKFVRILNDNPRLRIRVEGHTDNVGDFDKNVELSRNRAESVKAYLVEKGIAADRIETRGYGPTKPIVKGNDEEQRQKNRRVEIVVLES